MVCICSRADVDLAREVCVRISPPGRGGGGKCPHVARRVVLSGMFSARSCTSRPSTVASAYTWAQVGEVA